MCAFQLWQASVVIFYLGVTTFASSGDSSSSLAVRNELKGHVARGASLLPSMRKRDDNTVTDVGGWQLFVDVTDNPSELDLLSASQIRREPLSITQFRFAIEEVDNMVQMLDWRENFTLIATIGGTPAAQSTSLTQNCPSPAGPQQVGQIQALLPEPFQLVMRQTIIGAPMDPLINAPPAADFRIYPRGRTIAQTIENQLMNRRHSGFIVTQPVYEQDAVPPPGQEQSARILWFLRPVPGPEEPSGACDQQENDRIQDVMDAERDPLLEDHLPDVDSCAFRGCGFINHGSK